MSAPPGGPVPESRQLTPQQIVPLLCQAEMTVLEMLPWSSNYTLLVHLQQGEHEFHGVYKPQRGERPLWDFPRGTLYQREVAAFQLSQALGWHIVPPTVEREGAYGVGMVQFYVTHDPEEHFFTLRDPWTLPLDRIALFDVLANNADRKGGHLLRDSSSHIWGIDHGLCFHVEPKLRTVIWDQAGERIPPRLLEDLERVQRELAERGALFQQLSALLSAGEVAALEGRIQTTLDQPRFPHPPADRIHVPWPMI